MELSLARIIFLTVNTCISFLEVDPALVLRFLAAAAGGDARAVAEMLRTGMPIDSHDVYGCTALHWAVINNCTNVINELVKHEVDVNVQDSNGHTPLHRAANNNHADVTKTLLQHGADPSIEDNTGQTALDYAYEWNKEKVIPLLQQHQVSSS